MHKNKMLNLPPSRTKQLPAMQRDEKPPPSRRFFSLIRAQPPGNTPVAASPPPPMPVQLRPSTQRTCTATSAPRGCAVGTPLRDCEGGGGGGIVRGGMLGWERYMSVQVYVWFACVYACVG